ncbi:MAG: AmmeMemoRadiSam system radical SAM enzyme [Candidatus Omnitrophota bacterium]
MRHKAVLWEKMDKGRVHCYLCSHYCEISGGKFGFCGTRQNLSGELCTYAYGKIAACNIDPIEKKPLYNFLAGTKTYSIAVAGCNFRCPFCQNWNISRVSAENSEMPGRDATPEQIVEGALANNCPSISYTYTEPTIFFEYAYDTACLAKARGLCNIFVTNGYMTEFAIEKLSPYLDAANVDIKFFSDDLYKKMCGGRLQPVLDSVRRMKQLGIWVEVTTLIIPELNDSPGQLKGIADFLAEIGKDIPWHVTRFHPAYKYTDSYPTPVETIEKAVDIGKKAGLKYVYSGNV